MDWGLITPIFPVLLPFLFITLFVVLRIKREFDEYVPMRIAVRMGVKNRKVLIETRKKRFEIAVKDFREASSKEVLEVRINGLSFGKYRLGLYKGPYGYVESYATSDSGILIDGEEGKRYFLAFKNVGELVEMLGTGEGTGGVISVKS
ncbi:hypothetical protein FH039_10765 [Thermococcus indicus]|uniref:Uncharacterized protein n=1 Tax=Thermococcus indicus TaxID=2586643 RepID=A0A4Y5SPF7_9EURY|nr:hypothetical protein [Thermococcus indicus]QDA31991.1 hypothetical protein FH039_10765 [Thermococcus indicus]